MTSMLCTIILKNLINHVIYLFCKQKMFKIFVKNNLYILQDSYTHLFKISININLIKGHTNFFKHARKAFFYYRITVL